MGQIDLDNHNDTIQKNINTKQQQVFEFDSL